MLWLLVIAAVFVVVTGLPALISRITCPFEVAQTEPEIVQKSLDVLHGKPFFGDYHKGEPILYDNGSLVFFVLQVFAMKGLGGIWLPGRLVAFSSYVGSVILLIFWGIKRWNPLWTALAVAFLLLSPTWAFWSTIVRADTLMLFFNFSCLILVGWEPDERDSRKASSEHRWRLAAAGFLNALALLIKISAGTVTAGIFFFLLIRKKWPSLVIFLTCSVLTAALVTIFFQWYSRGISSSFGFGLPTGFHFELFFYFLRNSFLPESAWLVGAVSAAYLSGRMPLLWKCQMLFSFLWLFSLGVENGAENYYMEFILFGIAAVGETFGKPLKKSQTDMKVLPWVFLVSLLFVLGFFQMTRLPWPQPPSPEVRAMKSEVLAIYKLPGEHLAVDEDLPLMAGKRVWLQFHGYRELVDAGRLDPKVLSNEIKNRFFTTIELYDTPQQNFLPDETVREIKDNYEVRIRKFGRVWLFPKIVPETKG